ncbi:ribonuclease H-like domain-containing protein [Tanacetum coccineum]
MVGPSSSYDNIELINNLDVGNPLHIQTNDNSNLALIPFKLLRTENYKIWASAMKLALHARNKFSFVDGSCLKATYATKLESTYDKVDGFVIFNLLQKINNVKQGGSSVADYYHRLKSLWREFDALTKLPKCVCEVKCSCTASSELVLHQQLMKPMQFLMGLDDCYQPIRSVLLTRALPEVKDAYTNVSREESHRGILESSGVSDSKLNATSFAAKSFNNNRRNFNNNTKNNRGFTQNNNVNRGLNPNLNCKNYGKVGHTIDRCFEIVGFPPGFKRNSNVVKQNFNANIEVKLNDKQSSSSSPFSGFTSEQMQKLLSLINDSPSSSIHANMVGKASFFNGNVWFNINFSKFVCVNSKLYVKNITIGWIIDSGANQHLTVSTIGMFNVVDITSLNITVGQPNGTLATISHVGNLILTSNVVLYDVLVVSGYCVSLMSVNKLIRDSNMFVGFDENKCYIHDLKNENILGTGSESGGLYLFDMIKDNSIGKYNMVMCFNVSKLLWHNRLGHSFDQVLSVLHQDLDISKTSTISVCEVCHRAKHTRDPFPLSSHKSKHLSELVHLDLWGGPYRVPSREGFKYFLTIVDDYSRAIWVYLIKTKDKVFDVFVSFINFVHNQFDVKIKIVRFDNGTVISQITKIQTQQ